MSNAGLVFAGGGTGGHLYPGLAVAEAVRAADPSIPITFFTTNRALDRQLLEPSGFAQREQPVRPVTLHPLRWPGFLRAWRRSVCAARDFLRSHEVRAVLGLGGYAAGPPVVAASQLGIRTALLNPDAIPGRANRFLARRTDLVVLQWEASRKCFSTAVNCQTLGCPIRAGFAEADREAGRRHFGLAPDRPVLLVTGASQGARTVNEAMMRVWPSFRMEQPNWQLLHLSGAADEPAVSAAYAAAGAAARVVSFTHEMPQALAAADLVISRAGASTLAELTALGKPAILLPYPYHRDRHQHANAQVLVDQGAAIMLEDQRDAEANTEGILYAVMDAARAERLALMTRAAGGLGRPDAARRVAEWLLSSP
jgi:UDP-N-acetylglucosamine--N-acetylmuramyl-(pentapeptide) pyrophosphoryl-undecaprenol N-acetylglucosamine transferase